MSDWIKKVWTGLTAILLAAIYFLLRRTSDLEQQQRNEHANEQLANVLKEKADAKKNADELEKTYRDLKSKFDESK
jgi:cell shape-determining protein MreC